MGFYTVLKFIQVCLHIICSTIFLSSAVNAQDHITLSTNLDWPPFVMDEMPEHGFLTEIVQKTFTNSDIETSIETMPWERALREVAYKDNVASYIYGYSNERAKKYYYSDPIFKTEPHLLSAVDSVLTLADMNEHYRNAQQRQNIFCHPINWLIEPTIANLIQDKRLILANPSSMKDCFKLFSIGKSQFIIATQLESIYTFTELEKSIPPSRRVDRSDYQMTSLGEPLPLHVIFSKTPKGKALRDKFNASLKVLKETGEYDNIISHRLASYGIEDAVIKHTIEYQHKELPSYTSIEATKEHH